MSRPCNCCTGIQIITPQMEANPPGMSSLKYRAGDYSTFFETMLARLSTLRLDIATIEDPGALQTLNPLKRLTTREPSDFSINLLDAWAIVSDVLTFYQERVANEGYLGTAVERRSLLELARLVSYTLRPGVAASAHLAFTVQTGFNGVLPAGTRAQSLPGSGQMPQFYETSDDLSVSDAWNNLVVRRTRPQVIASAGVTGRDPATLHTLYFQGITTNLKVGDAVIIVSDNPALRLVDSVTPQATDQRTLVHFRSPAGSSVQKVTDLAKRYLEQSSSLFPGSVIAGQAASQLNSLIDGSQQSDVVVTNLKQLQSLAVSRKSTRLSAWLSDLLSDLVGTIHAATVALAVASGPSLTASSPSAQVTPEPVPKIPASALKQIDEIIAQLAMAPSQHPPNSLRLSRTLSSAFAAKSDIAPRLLAEFYPSAAATLYQAWTGITTEPAPAAAFAARVKAGLFANNYSGAPSVVRRLPTRKTSVAANGVITDTVFTPPTLGDTVRDLISADTLTGLPLDTVYDQIMVGSWIAIERPILAEEKKRGGRTMTYHRVESVQTVSRETSALTTDQTLPPPLPAATTGGAVERAIATGFTAKVTLLTLNPPWLSELSAIASGNKDLFPLAMNSTPILRGTVIYAQSEPLDLAEEPLDADVGGATIELNGVYKGLESGRWMIVSGDRTDLPNTTVAASELVMIAGVSQELTDTPGDTVHTTLTLADKGLAYTYNNATVTLYGNVAHVTHGQSVGQVLGNGNTAQPFQTFTLGQTPLTYLPSPTPAGAQSTLSITVNEMEWDETDDITALGPTDHGYITQTDNSGRTSVIFGDGEHGARVPSGKVNVKAMYRYGIGAAGNVAAGQISQLATRPLGAQSVVNPLASSGGADADTVAQARSNTPLAVKALDRLVSIRDYADFSRGYAGIAKADAIKISNGRRQVVYVTIAGNQDFPIDVNSELYQNLVQSLEKFGDPQQPVGVGVRSVKLLVIIAGIQVLPHLKFDDVQPKVKAALLDAFSFENRGLSQNAFLSEAIGVIQSVDGVAFVNVSVFDSVTQGISAKELATLSQTLVRRGHVDAKPARVKPSSASQSFQIDPAELVYLTPDIKDTLILTEITLASPGPVVRLPSNSMNRRRTRRSGGTQ